MRGFSLLELLIAVAIISVIFGLGFLNLSGYRERQMLNLAGDELAAVLRDTAGKAVKQECIKSETECAAESNIESWGVHFDSGINTYYVFQGGTYASGVVDSRKTLKAALKFKDLTGADFIFAQLTGLPTPAPFTVKIALTRDESVFTTITIEINGRITKE